MKEEKLQELKLQKVKSDKMTDDLKAQFKKDKEFLVNEHNKQVTQLEHDLKIARSGFEAEREALEKKRTDMQEDYEK